MLAGAGFSSQGQRYNRTTVAAWAAGKWAPPGDVMLAAIALTGITLQVLTPGQQVSVATIDENWAALVDQRLQQIERAAKVGRATRVKAARP